MPFITARVISVIRPDTAALGFVSAGPDQSVLCATLVQLEAVIIGDITQHTFEWEQSFGTPVTLINPNTLTPSFVNPQTSEIIFTFYTDRGTPFEQSDDVLISRRPTDIFRNSLGTGADPNTGGTGSPTTSNVVLPQFRDLNVRLTNDTYNYPAAGYSPIYTVTDLDKVREDLGGSYWLMNDIDLSSYTNWNPIGTLERPFYGEFQGNGYIIDNMTIANVVRNVGLFGHANSGALIEKLGVTNASVTGNSSSWYAAILVGSAAGNATGVFDGGTLTIRDCYVEGAVDSDGDRGGGLIGYTGTNTSTLFENTYADVTVTGGGTRTGGWCGWWELEIATGIENYWNETKTVAGFGSAGDTPGATEVSGLTTAQLTAETNFTGWNFTTTWEIDEGVTPPTVQEQTPSINTIRTGAYCDNYMITWNRPDSRTYTFVGSYYETRSGTNWIDKTFVSADQNHISVAAGQYRLTTIWRHAVTGLVTRDVEIIHTAGLTAPSGRPGGVEALRGVVGAASTNNLIIIIQNPRKISKSETDTLARSIGDATSNEVTNLVRGSGVQKDLGIDTLKQSIGDATFGGDVVVNRDEGASIG